MDSIRLFLLKIILVSIILNVATKDHKAKGISHHINEQTDLEKINNELKIASTDSVQVNNHPKNISNPRKYRKQLKKSKRDAYGSYGKYWARKSSNFGYGGSPSNNMPLYLVFNRKVGAYYPYYKFPKDNTIRRNSNMRNK